MALDAGNPILKSSVSPEETLVFGNPFPVQVNKKHVERAVAG
jgi:hypothetical protein